MDVVADADTGASGDRRAPGPAAAGVPGPSDALGDGGRGAGRVRWWRRLPRPPLVDAVIVLAAAFVQVGGTAMAATQQPERQALDAGGVALLVAGCLALFARRRWPVVTAGATLAATATYIFLDYPRGPVWMAMIVALVTLVMAGRRVEAVAYLAVGYLIFAWAPFLVGSASAPGPGVAVGLAAWLLVLLAAAEAVRVRRERAAAAARELEEETRRRVGEERLRIARELHDVVAHTISLVNVQAGVALHLIDERPEQARVALAAIKDASKEALVELRSILGILRQADEAAPRDPAPGLDRLDSLVAQARSAGLDVRVTVDGAAGPLAAGVDLAAFRIVQEALTNAARHAGPAAVDVHVTYGPDDLVVEVVDDGRTTAGRAGPGSDPRSGDTAGLGAGAGLAGMRERAEAVGGELEVGPRPGFGWRVRARLPRGRSESPGPSRTGSP